MPNISFYGGNNVDTLLLVAALTDPILFHGENGDDVADGGAGDDTLHGGPGVDDIRGHNGNDYIDGGEDGNTGLTELNGGDGFDQIFGGSGNDKIRGGNDNDIIYGRDGADFIEGDDGDDLIFGEGGADFLHGDVNVTPSPVPGGQDEIWGGGGPDTIKGGPQGDIIWSNGVVPDQPYNGVLPAGGIPGSPDILGTGENLGGCDWEDGNPDTDAGCPGGPGGGAPIANADSFSDSLTRYIEDYSPGILGNDSGVDLYAELISDVLHGSLNFNSDGGFSYTPNTGFYGVDYFRYLATDGTNSSNVTTVVLHVEVPDAPPVAVDDEEEGMYSLGETPPGVLANDTGSAILTAILLEGTQHGELSLGEDGGYVYFPDSGFYGTDTFTYVATDGYWVSNIATMTLTILEPLELDLPANPGGAAALADAQLVLMSQAAIDRWRAAGVSERLLADRLAGVTFAIADLPRSALGGAAGNRIVIDRDAAGYGWFVDSTPGSDREFTRQTFATERVALAGSEAYGHVDLLTVLQHEIGHLLGLEHTREAGDIMQGKLSLGTRRWADASDAALAQLSYENWLRDRRR